MKVNTRKLKKLARTIKKDTKRLLRTLYKMKRHGWLVVDKTDGLSAGQSSPPLCAYCGKPVLKRGDGFMHITDYGKKELVHHVCHLKMHEKREEELTQ